MKGFIDNIEKDTLANENFRKVLYTAKHLQLVLMSLKPKEEIGEEVHEVDQFIRIEAGSGEAVLDGVSHPLPSEHVVVIPAGTRHNIINTSADEHLKLYTIYAPPEHKDGEVHTTKKEAEENEQHFDGKTTE